MRVETKFTPGPWEAPRNGLDGAVYAPNAPKGTLWRITDGVRGLTHEEIAANARLIAAAPEMLEAANAVLDHFMPSFGGSREVDDCLVQLAAAVAKAVSE